MPRILFLSILLAACARAPQPAVERMALNGDWRLRSDTDSTWLPATVPGTVHTDLLAAGRISDSFVGHREADLQWIEDEGWRYRRTFDVDARLLRHQRLDLIFEGLDTWATVTLNDQVILTADNMFRTWRVDVRGVVRAGPNVLEVRFAPPVAAGKARSAVHPWPIPHQEPDVSGARAFSRKAAYHFGWDWGPRYVTSGIWRPVALEAWSGARIVGVHVASVRWSAGGDQAEVRLGVDVELARDRVGGAQGNVTPRALRLGVRSPEGAFAPAMRTLAAAGPDGVVTVDVPLTFPAAEPWWPRGMGRPAGRRYEVEVDLVQGTLWDRRSVKVGLRTVELVTEPDPGGETFFFRLNGEPVFARGANVVPPDHFTPRADSAVYARLIDDALAANMNMLRVWGGGVYLPDVFYDLADEAGLMVWQDFMFANTLVPEDTSFVASVSAEAEDQVRRLRRHPSLALWCGNNEVAEGWANWGWRDAYAPDVAERVSAAYRRVFEDVLADAVARLAPAVPYVPSSPRIGWGHPESLAEGDSHYWGVWWGMEPFRVYAERVPRFASEFGFQALPDPLTLAAFADGSHLPQGLTDPAMHAHQKHPTGYETIRTYVAREWPVPPDDSLDAWSYVSQLAQAEGVGLALEAHRRGWPRTGGTLYWQLNDTWPVVSWSSVDAFGRWKALHHRARDVFAPVAVLADAWGDSVGVWVAADEGAVPAADTLTVRVSDFQGNVVVTRSVAVALEASRSVLAWAGTVADLLPPGVDPRDVWVEAAFLVPGDRLRDISFLVPPNRLRLPDPGLAVVGVEPAGAAWVVTLTAERFAYAVRLSLDGVGARMSDNFMHIPAGDTVRIRVEPETPTPDLGDRVRVRSLGGR